MVDLVDFIKGRDYARLRAELPELIALANKVAHVHAEKLTCPRGLAAHLRTMHAAVLDHLDKEKQRLFPLIRAGRGSVAGSPIHALESAPHPRALNSASRGALRRPG